MKAIIVIAFVAFVAIAAASILSKANQEAEASFSEKASGRNNELKDDGTAPSSDLALAQIPVNQSSHSSINETVSATTSPTLAVVSGMNDTTAMEQSRTNIDASHSKPADDDHGNDTDTQSLSNSHKSSAGSGKNECDMAPMQPSSKGPGRRFNFDDVFRDLQADIKEQTRESAHSMLIFIGTVGLVGLALTLFACIRICFPYPATIRIYRFRMVW